MVVANAIGHPRQVYIVCPIDRGDIKLQLFRLTHHGTNIIMFSLKSQVKEANGRAKHE